MTCSCCEFSDTAEGHFTQEKAASELNRYRRKGPGPTTRRLRDGLVQLKATGGTVLDIGGGVGALSFELLDRGATHAIVVDASPAYVAMGAEEAARRDRAAATEFVLGDFVLVSDRLLTADLVTLDRVVCCYPTYEPLLEQALRHARRTFAYSYPRARWYVRSWVWFDNAKRRWKGNPFRTFVHPPCQMQRLIEAGGFTLGSRRRTWFWSADVFVRSRK